MSHSLKSDHFQRVKWEKTALKNAKNCMKIELLEK